MKKLYEKGKKHAGDDVLLEWTIDDERVNVASENLKQQAQQSIFGSELSTIIISVLIIITTFFVEYPFDKIFIIIPGIIIALTFSIILALSLIRKRNIMEQLKDPEHIHYFITEKGIFDGFNYRIIKGFEHNYNLYLDENKNIIKITAMGEGGRTIPSGEYIIPYKEHDKELITNIVKKWMDHK